MEWLGQLKGVTGKANTAYANEKAERAKVEENPAHVILNPKDITGSYDAGRLLLTTLGGEPRLITASDLVAFSQNANQVKSRYTKGITAKQVIQFAQSDPNKYISEGWAGKSDIDKAQSEIKHAIPHSIHKGLIRFITPSASDKAKRHYVAVRFMSWQSAIVSPVVNKTAMQPDWRKTALWLKNQPLRFDCDCGRHRYWFRYIATIGQYNEGRDERGYPKIRNPRLHGVACKHVLRVMSDIQTGHSVIVSLIAKALEKEHAALSVKSKRIAPTLLKQSEAEKMAKSKGRTTVGRNLTPTQKAVKEASGSVQGKAKTAKQKTVEAIKQNAGAMAVAQQLADSLGISVEALMGKIKD